MNEALIAGGIIFVTLSLVFLMVYAISITSSVVALKQRTEELADYVEDLGQNLDCISTAILRSHYQALSCTSIALEGLELAHIDKENFERCASLQKSRSDVVRAMTDMYRMIHGE